MCIYVCIERDTCTMAKESCRCTYGKRDLQIHMHTCTHTYTYHIQTRT